MRKHLLSSLAIAVAVFFLVAEGTKEIPKTVFTFDWQTKQLAAPGSAGMVLGLIKPSYAEKFNNSKAGTSELFQRFRESMGGDVEEMVIAKGFTMRGPFDSKDDMLFQERKNAHVMLNITVIPEFTATQGAWKLRPNSLRDQGTKQIINGYTYKGTTALICKIQLVGSEPLTGEVIWRKSVETAPIPNIILQSSKPVSEQSIEALLADGAIYNAVGEALRKNYGSIMDKIDAQINADEMKSLMPQITELKSKK